MLTGVWLVRHGETDAPAGVAIGSSDPPLSSIGRAQAQALALELAVRPLTAVYASDKIRAIATAEPIAQAHGMAIHVDRRVRELDFGAWEGRSLAELWTEDAEAARNWERDLRATPPSFAENVAALELRVAAFWEDACERSTGEVAVVAHGGSLAALRALITGASLEAVFASQLDLGTALWVEGRDR